MPRRYALLLMLGLAGCSGGKTTEELIAEDVKARGLDRPPPQAAPAPAASEFKSYSSPDGVFRVNFPGEPRFVDHGPSKPDHRTNMESYVMLREPRQYSILCAHHEEAPEPAKELQRLSDYLLSRTLEGKLVDSQDVTLKGRTGGPDNLLSVVAQRQEARRSLRLPDR